MRRRTHAGGHDKSHTCVRRFGLWGHILILAMLARPVSARTPAATDGAMSLELPRLMGRLLVDSPTVRAARHEWMSRTRNRAQVTALPDPQVDFRDFLRQMDPADDRWMLSFSQRIPWPEKRRRAGRVADLEARQAYFQYLRTLAETISEVKQSYHEIVYIDHALDRTRELERIYARMELLAAQGMSTGGTTLPETFRAATQRSQLAYDVIRLSEMRRVEEERLRFKVGLHAEERVGGLRPIAVSEAPFPSLQDLTDRMIHTNQELEDARTNRERALEEVRRARVASHPDITLMTSYSRTGGQDFPGGDPTQDPITATIGLTVPVWQEKYRALRRQAGDLRNKAQAREEEVERDLRYRLARAHFEVINSWRLVELHRRTLLPQAEQVMVSAEELHRRGDTSLLSVLETTSAYHSFRLAALRAEADYHQGLARLEVLLGAPFSAVIDAGSSGSSTVEQESGP